MNIGFESYQDTRLIPAEYWETEAPTEESIRDELIEKYRAEAVTELDTMLAAGEIDEYTAEDEEFLALEIAAGYGETVEKIMRRHENNCATERSEWLAGRAW